MAKVVRGGETCAIARTVDVLKDPWSFLILRDALSGVTRFADFRASLGIATDVLTERLNTLVEAGVLRREEYREAGSRTRTRYQLTPAGAEFKTVIAALQQWGDAHLPVECGPTVARVHGKTGAPIEVAFVDARGRRVKDEDATFERTAAYPAAAVTVVT